MLATTVRPSPTCALRASSGARAGPSRTAPRCSAKNDEVEPAFNRRQALLGAGAATALELLVGGLPAHATGGSIAGRIPGVAPDPELEGWNLYKRPLGKSGGHGIGWSEIPQYRFNVPTDWEEVPVSIADLGGTEIDLRFANRDKGSLFVVVAPVMRFRDIPFNADVRIEDLGDPEKIIKGFAPELFGGPLEEGALQEMKTSSRDGLTYYSYKLSQPKPHIYVTATAVRNRVFIMGASANSRQYRKGGGDSVFEFMTDSFNVEIPEDVKDGRLKVYIPDDTKGK